MKRLVTNPVKFVENAGRSVGAAAKTAAPFLPPGLREIAAVGGSVAAGGNLKSDLTSLAGAEIGSKLGGREVGQAIGGAYKAGGFGGIKDLLAAKVGLGSAPGGTAAGATGAAATTEIGAPSLLPPPVDSSLAGSPGFLSDTSPLSQAIPPGTLSGGIGINPSAIGGSLGTKIAPSVIGANGIRTAATALGGMSTMDKLMAAKLGLDTIGGIAGGVASAKSNAATLAEQQRQFNIPASLELENRDQTAGLRDAALYGLQGYAAQTPGQFRPHDIYNPSSLPPQQGGYDPALLAAHQAAYRPGMGGVSTSIEDKLLRQMGYGRAG